MSERNFEHLMSHRMGRRSFLGSATLAAAALSTGARGNAARARPVDSRPNILVITTDQQWAGAMSCVGNPYLNTPAIDRLACIGVTFEAAYTANPICVPARTSFMTGTTSHENGVITNVRENQVELTMPCLAKLFRDNGYDTGYVGKWHIPRSIEDTEWSGFDYRALIRDGGVDSEIPDFCAKFIEKERENPFFLIASFVNPHDICQWARRHSGIDQKLPNGEIGAPPAPGDCPPLRPNHAIPEGEPSVVRRHQADENMQRAYPTRNWEYEDGRWRQYLWGYYRMVELVDTYIGRLLDVLHESEQIENTVIVLTSDHGDGLGSHCWNQKTIFYDEISRIPFIVCWQGRTKPCGRDRHHLINVGTDLFPTLFEFAGIHKPERLRGLSAVPFALGQNEAPTHQYIVSENNLHSGGGHPTDVHGRMLRSARYKYVRYNQGNPTEQLFDLELDPGETRDLTVTNEVPQVLAEHRRMLDEYILTTGDNFPRFAAS